MKMPDPIYAIYAPKGSVFISLQTRHAFFCPEDFSTCERQESQSYTQLSATTFTKLARTYLSHRSAAHQLQSW
jgi:hypothetical protein